MDRNYGLILKAPEPEHWVKGSGKATERFGATALMPDGHGWDSFIPSKEIQRRGSLETSACTIFGTLNCYETLAKRHGFQDFPSDCAERFNAILAGVTPQGAEIHKACEAVRCHGVIPEEALPFSETIYDWNQFYSPVPMTKQYFDFGVLFLRKFIFGHEWVWGDNTPLKEKQRLLKEALARGTVGVTVTAWRQKNGKYHKRETDQDNHWLQLVDYKEGEYWVVNDHYDPTEKKLEWNYDFAYAKVFFLSRNATGELPNSKGFLLSLMTKLLDSLKSLLKITPIETEVIEEPVAPKTKAQELHEAALSFIGKDASPDNHANNEVGCADSVSLIIQKVFHTFPHCVSTKTLDESLKLSSSVGLFKQTTDIKAGSVIVSPRTETVNGHTGIFTENGRIISNDSSTGLMQDNYSWESWIKTFKTGRGLRIFIYEPIN